MSRTHTEMISCPGCGASSEFTIYESLNVSIDPELKTALLERALTTFTCPECDYEVQISHDLLYHDMHQKVFVWLKYPDGDEVPMVDPAAELMLKMTDGYRCRLVTNLNDLTEKILLFDDDYDDLEIEVLKIMAAFSEKIDLANEFLYRETKRSLLGRKTLVFVEIGDDVREHKYAADTLFSKARKLANRLRPSFEEEFGRWSLYSRQTVMQRMQALGWLKRA